LGFIAGVGILTMGRGEEEEGGEEACRPPPFVRWAGLAFEACTGSGCGV